MKRLLQIRLADPGTISENFRAGDILLTTSAGIWLTLVAFGLGFLMVYANRPGEQGDPLETWPKNELVQLSGTEPTLLVFAHPKCPCTTATMTELDRIMQRCRGDVDCHVLFFQADGTDDEWSQTPAWRSAESIAGVEVKLDPRSQAATQFGVRTSGHVLLYDRDGNLAFEGGITPSRGHPGDNPGREQIVNLLRGAPSDSAGIEQQSTEKSDSTCVFGCPLHSPRVADRPSPTDGKG